MRENGSPWLQLDTANPESLHRRLKGIGAIEPPADAEVRSTAALVRRHATSAADEATLLEMLGIADG